MKPLYSYTIDTSFDFNVVVLIKRFVKDIVQIQRYKIKHLIFLWIYVKLHIKYFTISPVLRHIYNIFTPPSAIWFYLIVFYMVQKAVKLILCVNPRNSTPPACPIYPTLPVVYVHECLSVIHSGLLCRLSTCSNLKKSNTSVVRLSWKQAGSVIQIQHLYTSVSLWIE